MARETVECVHPESGGRAVLTVAALNGWAREKGWQPAAEANFSVGTLPSPDGRIIAPAVFHNPPPPEGDDEPETDLVDGTDLPEEG